jgi:uncharacterized protein (TIGR02757 family)
LTRLPETEGAPPLQDFFNELYLKYNRPEYIHPDPLELVLRYPDSEDREIAGLVASCLSLGRVNAILKSVSEVLRRLNPLRESVLSLNANDLRKLFADFTYRFYSGRHIVDLISGIRGCIERFGSLGRCFRSMLPPDAQTVYPAAVGFVAELSRGSHAGASCPLLPLPERGSSCKRLHLYLRWMIRKDDVDPGCWTDISPSLLLFPVDTHILRLSRTLGITQRRQGDLKTSLEITSFFKTFRPEDPVRYDFCLSRMGIHPELKEKWYELLPGEK